jgi:hypothetical protein
VLLVRLGCRDWLHQSSPHEAASPQRLSSPWLHRRHRRRQHTEKFWKFLWKLFETYQIFPDQWSGIKSFVSSVSRMKSRSNLRRKFIKTHWCTLDVTDALLRQYAVLCGSMAKCRGNVVHQKFRFVMVLRLTWSDQGDCRWKKKMQFQPFLLRTSRGWVLNRATSVHFSFHPSHVDAVENHEAKNIGHLTRAHTLPHLASPMPRWDETLARRDEASCGASHGVSVCLLAVSAPVQRPWH